MKTKGLWYNNTINKNNKLKRVENFENVKKSLPL